MFMRPNAMAKKERLLMFILFSILLLYFIFAPALNGLFYTGDDFRYAFGGYGKSCGGDDGFYFMKTLGRPLQAYIDCLSYRFAYTFERMRVVRFISVVLLGCVMGLLAEWLYALGFTLLNAFFAAGILVLIQKLVNSAILVGSIPLPLAVLFVIFAYHCLQKSHTPHQGSKEIMWLALAGILLISALLCYPAMTFFFGSLPLIKVLFSRLDHWQKTRREIIREVVVFFIVCAIYFMWAYYNMRYHARAPISSQYQITHPNLFILEIFNRLTPVVNVFTGPWALFPLVSKTLQGWLMLIAIGAGIAAGWALFYRKQIKPTVSSLVQAALAVIALLFLCSGFYLVIPQAESMDSQILFATAESGVILFIWGIYRFSELFKSHIKNSMLLAIFCLVFLVKGYQFNIWMVAHSLGYAQNINYIKTKIADFVAKGNKLRRVHYINSRKEYPYDKFFLTNGALMGLYERGSYDIAWCSLPRGNPDAEKDHQEDTIKCIDSLPVNGIAVTYTYPDEPFKKMEGMLTIDMQNVPKGYFINQYLKSLFNV